MEEALSELPGAPVLQSILRQLGGSVDGDASRQSP